MSTTFSSTKTEVAFKAWEERRKPFLIRERGSVGDAEEDLSQLLLSMLYVSSFVYLVGTLRKYVKEQHEKPKWWQFCKRPVQLQKTELILKDAEGTNFPEDVLKETIPASDFADFIKTNLRLFDEIKSVEINESEEGLFNVFDALEDFVLSDSELVEFDDVNQEQECVYAITINRGRKRITVIFRGSVTINDWITNFKNWSTTLDTPPLVKENGFEEEIKIHAGYHEYLFAKESKCKQIENQVNSLLGTEEFADYSICVTGHSLGGALTQLVSFELAASKDLRTKQPITAMSFASPYAGEGSFNRAYQVLERMGRLRHIRISNEGDKVPVSPEKDGFTHTGLSIHLQKNGKRVMGYRNVRREVEKSTLLERAKAHQLNPNHWARIMEHKEEFSKCTVSSLYSDKDLVGDFTA